MLKPAYPVFPLVLLLTSAAGAGEPAGDESIVRFRDRAIDLRPFVEGFPYKSLTPDYRSRRLFYLREDAASSTLLSLPLPESGQLDLSAGKPVLGKPLDWNGRSLFRMEYHPSTDSLVLLGDEKNDEVLNLFRLSLRDGSLSRVTGKPYVYGFGVERNRGRVAYLPRYGAAQPYRSAVDLLDWATGEDREIARDTPIFSLTWCQPVFRPDGSGLVVAVNAAGDRKRKNLAWLDIAKGELEVLTDPAALRNTVDILEEWVDDDRFLYVSDESGYSNLYLYDLRARSSKPLTTFREELSSWAPLTVDGRLLAALVIKRPYESELVVVDPRRGAEGHREVFDDTTSILDHHGEKLYVHQSSVRTYQKISEWRFQASGDRLSRSGAARVEPAPEVTRALDQCVVERVQIPTFDQDPATGKTRLLHAYLFLPRNPPARAEQRFALITAFYGGPNSFDVAAEVVGAAGGICLSPAVRGSAGFGREFFSLNDRDLGGNEIVDVIYAGRYLKARFGLIERQIGPWGASHGGYATLRLLTFPQGVNGRQESFDWGFGIDHAGFSSILTFYRTCNIPDWVKLEAGDPLTEAERLLDRSPITHLGLLRAPLLLTHGENDNRVPVMESRQLAEKAKDLRKPVTYLEFPGQGHGLKGIANQKKLWQARFSFLEAALDRERGQ